MVDYKQIDPLIKEDMDRSYADFKTDHPDAVISDNTYYKRRIMLKKDTTGPKKRMGHSMIDYSLIDGLIRENPDLTYSSFAKSHPKVKISDAAFYTRRRKINGKSSYQRSKPQAAKIYMQVVSIDGIAFQKESKMETLQSVISSINKVYNLKLEIIELNSPNQIEIRDVKK